MRFAIGQRAVLLVAGSRILVYGLIKGQSGFGYDKESVPYFRVEQLEHDSPVRKPKAWPRFKEFGEFDTRASIIIER